jgi:hypothetical protein
METLKTIADVVSFLANALTIGASSIAIYIFFTKRAEISSAFSALLGWSFQTTLSDLKGKLERLNEYNANEETDQFEIRNILHEIAGQIRGNQRLQSIAPDLANRLERLASQKKLSEPAKRSMVAEAREVIRNIQINSHSEVE